MRAIESGKEGVGKEVDGAQREPQIATTTESQRAQRAQLCTNLLFTPYYLCPNLKSFHLKDVTLLPPTYTVFSMSNLKTLFRLIFGPYRLYLLWSYLIAGTIFKHIVNNQIDQHFDKSFSWALGFSAFWEKVSPIYGKYLSSSSSTILETLSIPHTTQRLTGSRGINHGAICFEN